MHLLLLHSFLTRAEFSNMTTKRTRPRNLQYLPLPSLVLAPTRPQDPFTPLATVKRRLYRLEMDRSTSPSPIRPFNLFPLFSDRATCFHHLFQLPSLSVRLVELDASSNLFLSQALSLLQERSISEILHPTSPACYPSIALLYLTSHRSEL